LILSVLAFFFYFSRLMKIAVLFLPLFFVFFFGNVNALAGNSFIVQHPISLLNTHRFETFKDIHKGHGYLYFTDFTQSEEYKILICEEVEDLRSDKLTSRKDRLANSFLAIFYDQSCVDCLHNCVKVSPFFWRNTFYLYILQRTLRV